MTERQPRFRDVRAGSNILRTAVWHGDGKNKATARPLLFFNGIGANIELIAPLAEALTDRDIIAFDAPGVGGSAAAGIPYRPWNLARMAAAILDELGYHGEVDVMGVSWGGAMAQQFAFQFGSRVHRLILCATSAGMLMVPGNPKALMKLAHPRRYMNPDYMLQHFWTSVPFLPFLKQPTLVLAGDNDQIVPLINGRFLAQLIPGARLEIVSGGHLFLVSRASEVIPLIRDFLDEEPEPRPFAAKRRRPAAKTPAAPFAVKMAD